MAQFHERFLEYRTSLRTYYKIIQGVQGKRSRVIELCNCKNEEEVLQLEWVKNSLPFGKLKNNNQMGISQPKMTHIIKNVCVSMGGPYGIHDGWPTELPLITDELDLRTLNPQSASLFLIITNGNSETYPECTTVDYTIDEIPPFIRVGGYITSGVDMPNTVRASLSEQIDIGDEPLRAIGFSADLNFGCFIRSLNKDNVLTDHGSINANAGRRYTWSCRGQNVHTVYGFSHGSNRFFFYTEDGNGAYGYNWLHDTQFNFWVFNTKEELDNYLLTGDYKAALNYAEPVYDFDYMDLNIPGNSEVPNANYEFINPVAGLAYDTPQQIEIDWTIEGASKNPLINKKTVFNIPRNAHCFVLFTGKYVGVYCNTPGVTMKMDVFNGTSLIGSVAKQSDVGLLEVQDIFGMYEGYEPEGGVYNVKIKTPFIFIRQIYKCATREELPQKGTPTYEIFQPGTSSAYVNPNDTGELASVHLLSFKSIADMKAASDAERGGV